MSTTSAATPRWDWAPLAVFCAHGADVPWIEDRERILRERYGWYAAHDVDYSPEEKDWLRGAMGPNVPIDLRLSGGESFRLGPELVVQIIHLPGHSPGHVGLWEPTSRTAIITDAALGSGLYDMAGNVISPPPYFDVAAYEGSVRFLSSLSPQRLLTAHYEVMEGDDAARFLEESTTFIERARRAVAEALAEQGELTLRELLKISNPSSARSPLWRTSSLARCALTCGNLSQLDAPRRCRERTPSLEIALSG